MVTQHDEMATLKTLFIENPEIFTKYLLASSRIAVILLDKEGTILDCNQFFLDNLKLSDRPVGQSINAFLGKEFPVAGDSLRGDFQAIKLTFLLNNSVEHSLSGHIIKLNDLYIIFAHTLHLTDNELVAAISKLNDELTDITRELNKRNRELKAANATITDLMNTDPLTGLMNRRRLTEMLDKEMSTARRHGLSLAALMADIDHFKSVNDTYGHDMGDVVLIEIAHSLRDISRKEDIVARYGGEEFVVFLPNSTPASAMECAERMRKAIEGLVFRGINRKITASFGVTLFLPTDSEESLIKRADNALYEAKISGRNRVVLK